MRSRALDVLLTIEKDQSSAVGPDQIRPAFREFLVAEYTNIAQAHFNTVESLATFIRHYLLIASAPIFLLVLFADLRNVEATQISRVLVIEPLLAGIGGTVLFLMGLLLLGYAINIRCDTLLYARAVNGIRRYFYGMSSLTLKEELDLRVLPKTIRHPPYYEPTYFIFVVLLFSCVGMVYFGAGWYIYWEEMGHEVDVTFLLSLAGVVAGHVELYRVLTRYREGAYLRQNIIGVDVDGVLNNHRHHFAEFLKQLCGKEIDPDSISHVPVHEIPGTNITQLDEHAVFNRAAYWETMPTCNPSPSDALKKIRNTLGFRVWIFTYRPWPQGPSIPSDRRAEYWNGWRNAVKQLSAWDFKMLDKVNRWLGERGIPNPIADWPIRVITRRWLKREKIPFNRLTVERGNTDTPEPQVYTRNRFVISRDYRFRAFVDDDLTKARKLAHTCEIVFLFDQPYNQCDPASLPNNVLRVTSWPEIYRRVREIL